MKCIICGKEIEKSSYGNAILCSGACHTKNFWQEYVDSKNDPTHIVVKGEHYIIDKEETIGFRGHGGRTFVILKDNKQLIVTTNLWYQGTIPDEFKNQLPDNATMLPWIWEEIIKDESIAIIIDDTLYIAGSENVKDDYKVNKGQKFKILKGKEIIVSTNLKNWGTVPDGLREKYPSNAQFL